ncbi:MAG: cytochrome P450 [Actinomycetota bacterium]
MTVAVDPFAPQALEDPYPLYRMLRTDAPVYQLPQTGLWLVTRMADLEEAAANTRVFSSHISAIVYAGQGPNPVVIPADPDAVGAVDVLATQDPPAHTRQRKLLTRSFVASRIEELSPGVTAFVDERLDAVLPAGRVEWMEAVSNPLPLWVISNLLGFPDADAPRLKTWADAGVDLLSGVAPMERMIEAWNQMMGFIAYLNERQSGPAAGSITADIAAAVKSGDLTEREGVSLLLQLTIAGSESTTSLIGSAVCILAVRPDLQASLRADPGRIPLFLEEILRLESPFRGHFRVTTQEATLGGVAIPKDSRVMLMWGAANRDDAAFPHPDELDLDRAQPKAHVAFGSGIHFCIGAPLARMEARIAVARLLQRTSTFALADAPRHVPSLFVRRLASLELMLRATPPGQAGTFFMNVEVP